MTSYTIWNGEIWLVILEINFRYRKIIQKKKKKKWMYRASKFVNIQKNLKTIYTLKDYWTN